MRKGGKTAACIGMMVAQQKIDNFKRKYLIFTSDKKRFFSLLCAILYQVDIEDGKYIYEQLQMDATDFNKQYKVVTDDDKQRIYKTCRKSNRERLAKMLYKKDKHSIIV